MIEADIKQVQMDIRHALKEHKLHPSRPAVFDSIYKDFKQVPEDELYEQLSNLDFRIYQAIYWSAYVSGMLDERSDWAIGSADYKY